MAEDEEEEASIAASDQTVEELLLGHEVRHDDEESA